MGVEGHKLIRAGVIGWPIDHSLSPRLHRYWLEKYGITGTYEKVSVPPGELKQTLETLRDDGWVGCNITLPHKEEAAELMDSLDNAAERIGAVNTVKIGDDGLFYGSNTDAYGFIQNLRETCPDWIPGKTVVLGAGGSARAVLDALVESGVPEIHILNRTTSKAENLAQHFIKRDCDILVHSWENNAELFSEVKLVVNTTSLGMAGAQDLALDIVPHLPGGAIVYDLVYTPLYTPLLKQARACGLKTVTGIGMLVHQAVPGFQLWFGQKPEPDEKLVQFLTA